MIQHRRRVGDTSKRSRPLLAWALWGLPAPARAFLLLTEICALGLTVELVSTEAATTATLIRTALLVTLSVGYSEVAAHSTRMQRYLGCDKVFSNPMSVWSYAAVLTLPAGWAASFVVLQYAHALWQRRRDATGTPHRVVFTAAAAVLAQLTVAGLVHLAGAADGLTGHFLATATTFVGVPVFLVVDLAVLLTGMWMAARPPSMLALLPDADTLGYELGALVLGLATAEFVVHSPGLTPTMLVVVALLHRSSVVKSLQHSARTDSKTGLLTAAAWTDRAGHVLACATAAGIDAAVLLIDLDHFKAVNDTHGHLAGDRVLAAVSSCLRAELRDDDNLGRFGGEELVAVLDGTTVEETVAVADRLREAVGRLRVGEDHLRVTVSVGVAHTASAPRGASLDDLLARADAALYVAKHAGRDQVSLATA